MKRLVWGHQSWVIVFQRERGILVEGIVLDSWMKLSHYPYFKIKIIIKLKLTLNLKLQIKIYYFIILSTFDYFFSDDEKLAKPQRL